ncbi:MAG: hypothetical protein ACXWP5_06550 [Bdellovibrionota bacterium]
MRLAWSVAVIGVVLTFWLGMGPAGLNFGESLDCLIGTVVAGMVAILVTLRLQRMTGPAKDLVRGISRSYFVLYALYFATLLAVCKPVRHLHTFLIMFVPMVCDLGFTIVVFGPLQDQIIRSLQRKS